MSDEAALVARAARGDREAFDALLRPRWERFFRIALRIVGDAEDARDVAQKAALRLWQTLDRFRPGEDLDGWIYRMVTNLAIDSLRRRRARPEDAGRDLDAMSAHLADPGPNPEHRALVAELESALEAATRDLAPRQKAVFVLSRVEGLSHLEIARMLDMAPSTARNHLFQARAHVARRLRAHFPHLLGAEDTE